jgi:predicted enzyme related to lactoylglutathione lyase
LPAAGALRKAGVDRHHLQAHRRALAARPLDKGPKPGSPFNGALACDNVERTYEELKARGVEFASPPKKEPWGTFAVMKDPDGNEFVLSSKEPAHLR